MKKFLCITLGLYLLLNTVGYTVYAHFCGDKLTETSVITSAESCCEHEETSASEKEKSSCCKEESKQIILKDEYLKAQSENQFISLDIDIFLLPLSFVADHYIKESVNQFYSKTFHNRSVPLILMCQVFRI